MAGRKPPIPIIAVDLETGERRQFPTMTAAANFTQMSVTTALNVYKADGTHGKWYFCRPEAYPLKADRIRALAKIWQSKKSTREPVMESPSLVSLRIDAHTVIMVSPEKATPEYAARYRQRLADDDNKRTERSKADFNEEFSNKLKTSRITAKKEAKKERKNIHKIKSL